jgi:hypothetical protein
MYTMRATPHHMQDYSDSHWSKLCCYLSVVQYRAWHDMAPVVEWPWQGKLQHCACMILKRDDCGSALLHLFSPSVYWGPYPKFMQVQVWELHAAWMMDPHSAGGHSHGHGHGHGLVRWWLQSISVLVSQSVLMTEDCKRPLPHACSRTC